MTCTHATAVLPDPLPDAVAAALAMPVTDAYPPGAAAARIVQAVRAASLNGHGRTLSGSEHACAVLQRHPGLSGWSTHMFCMAAAGGWARVPPRTELGLAERLAVLHGCDLAWTPAVGGWVAWDGHRWFREDGEVAASGRVKAVVRGLVQNEAIMAEHDPDDEAGAKAARKFARDAQSARYMRAALELARSEPGVAVPIGAWDSRRELLCVQNGTVELTSAGAKLRGHDRADRLTRIARGDYRPGAAGPMWERFVREILPDPAVRAYVQRLAGYSLLGGNPERIMVVLFGPTSTGKSTLLETITHVLGDHAGPYDLTLLRSRRDEGPRADLVEVMPCRFIHTTEASTHWRLHADAIKRLTGADSLRARNGHSNKFVTGRPLFVPWLATNTAPQVIGADTALWRRLVVVPLTAALRSEDTEVGERMRTEEADAILTWLIDGWVEYTRHGLGEVPIACLAAAAKMRSDLSLVDAWLADQVENGEQHETPLDELFDAWCRWCTDARIDDQQRGDKIRFGRWLTDRGFGSRQQGKARARIRTGLRLRPIDG